MGKEMAACGPPINTAYKAMNDYREAVIGRTGTQLKLLEFTRDTSFDIVTAIATVQTGGIAAAGAAGGATEMLKSSSTELGKYVAGTSGGGAVAAKNIILDGVLGAASGAAGKLMKLKGEEVVKGVAETLAERAANSKWLATLGRKKVAEIIAKRLEKAAGSLFDSAIKKACKSIKEKTTPQDFVERSCREYRIRAGVCRARSMVGEEFF